MSLFDTGIRPIVDQHLLDEAAKVRDYGDYWSASSAGYCMRKVIFERMGVPAIEKAGDARKQRVFTSGHIFHEWVQGLTKEAGISIAQEVELQDEDLMVRGHFDDLILIKGKSPLDDDIYGGVGEYGFHHAPDPEDETPDHLILYDYKTVNSRAFTWAKQNGNKISYYHRMQLGTYMYMLRKGLPTSNPLGVLEKLPDFDIKQLTEARILKISKDDLRMEEQQLFWSDDLAKEVIDYWLELNRYWLDKKIPPCTCADHEGGFLAREAYNPFFYKDEPCSLEWYKLCKKEGKLK